MAPVKHSATVSIAASGSGTATIRVSDELDSWNREWRIKTFTITAGTDVTVDSAGVLVDGVATQETATFDADTVFGDLLSSRVSIAVSGSNAGTSAQDLTIEVVGIERDR